MNKYIILPFVLFGIASIQGSTPNQTEKKCLGRPILEKKISDLYTAIQNLKKESKEIANIIENVDISKINDSKENIKDSIQKLTENKKSIKGKVNTLKNSGLLSLNALKKNIKLENEDHELELKALQENLEKNQKKISWRKGMIDKADASFQKAKNFNNNYFNDKFEKIKKLTTISKDKCAEDDKYLRNLSVEQKALQDQVKIINDKLSPEQDVTPETITLQDELSTKLETLQQNAEKIMEKYRNKSEIIELSLEKLENKINFYEEGNEDHKKQLEEMLSKIDNLFVTEEALGASLMKKFNLKHKTDQS